MNRWWEWRSLARSSGLVVKGVKLPQELPVSLRHLL